MRENSIDPARPTSLGLEEISVNLAWLNAVLCYGVQTDGGIKWPDQLLVDELSSD